MIYIITELLLGLGCIGCIIWSNLAKSKSLEIILMTISAMCAVFFFVVIGFVAALPERDTADGATYKTPLEVVQNDEAIVPTEQQLENANRKIEIAKAEAEAKRIAAEGEAEANRIIAESITPDILLKMLIEKWNGELPTDVSIGKVEDNGTDT